MLAAVPADAVLDHLGPGADVVVPLANGEPVTVMDVVDAAGDRLEDVQVHQMYVPGTGPTSTGVTGTGCGTSRTSCQA